MNIRERKGPSRGIVLQCDPQERNSCAPKFEDRTLQETLQPERCARKEAWELANNVHELNDKGHVILAFRSLVITSTIIEETRGERICGRFWSSNAHAEQERSELAGTGDYSGIRKPQQRLLQAYGEVQTSEEAQVFAHVLKLFVTVQILDDTPAVLSLGKPCEEHGYPNEWASGQKQHLTKSGEKCSVQCGTIRSNCYPRICLQARPPVRLPHRSQQHRESRADNRSLWRLWISVFWL